MQLLNDGRDKIRHTHTIFVKEGECRLHKLMNGAYQLGEGHGSKIVTSMDDIALFVQYHALTPEVLADVQSSIDAHAPTVAKQERTMHEIHAAAAARPGTLDEMANALESKIPDLKATMAQMLMDLLVKNGVVSAQSNDQLPVTAPASPFIPASQYEPSATDVLSPGHMTPEAEYRLLQKSGLRVNPDRQVFDPEKVAGVDPSKWQDERKSENGAFEPDLVGVAAGDESEPAPRKGLKKHRA